ncbi:MAG: ABC transporter ATP-binding protein [Ardenticatenaceae bacterium]|nr:ABC transporter ATP-binding protein [Ardenticatenaceae bacterium]
MNKKVDELNESINKNRVLGLWGLMRGFRPIYGIAVLAVAVATLARTSIYYLMRFFIDDALTRENLVQILPWIALGFIGLAVAQGVFTYLSGRWAAYTAESIARRLRDYLYDHIQRLTFTYHDQTQTGELIQRVTSDVDAIRLFFSEQLIGIGRIILLFLVNFIGIMLLSPYLAWMSVLAIPPVLVVSFYFFRRVGTAFERFQEAEAVVSNRFQENVSGVRVVKAFARQKFEMDRFDGANKTLYQRGIQFALMHGTFWPITDVLLGAQMVFGFWLGAMMAIRGEITVGTYLAYAQMVTLIIWPIRNLGRLVTQMSTAAVSYSRVADIMAQTQEPLAEGDYIPKDGIRGKMRFSHVDFAYEASLKSEAVDKANTVGALAREQTETVEERLQVLHDISFEVEPGQIVALLGSTGSGKTSLANLVARFYEYEAGEITLDGVDLRRYPREYLRQHIGIVMQEPFLFSRTIRDNIAYGAGRPVTDEEVYEAAKAAAVHEVITTFPEGYNTIVGERGVTLSGGQKQRVALARTLLRNPSILILDDATSSVDTETESQIRRALNHLMENRTTFVIAHRIQSVMTADLVLVMDHGRIVQRGTHETLIKEDGIYRNVFNLQARIEDELQADLAEAVPA